MLLTVSLSACGGGAKTLIDNAALLARGGSGVGSPWNMFGKNSLRTRLSEHTGPPTNQVKWQYQTNTGVNGSASIAADGTVYVCDSGFTQRTPQPPKLYAFAPNGQLKWSYTLLGRGDFPAISADGSTIYVGGSVDGGGQYVDNKLYAISSSGSLRWTFTTGAVIYSAPVLGADGVIYFGSHDGKLYAVYPDGTLKWSYATGALIRSSPAIGHDGTVYIGSYNCKMHAIYEHDPDQSAHPDGSLKWTCVIGDYRNAYLYSSPAVGADDTVYVGLVDSFGIENGVYAISASGTISWFLHTTYGVYGSPGIGPDGSVYVGDYIGGGTTPFGHLYGINPDGTLQWTFVPQDGSTGMYSSPAIDADGTIYIAGRESIYQWTKDFYAVNPDGTLKWSFDLPLGTLASPSIGADGTVYIGCTVPPLMAKGKYKNPGALFAIGPGVN